MANDSPPHESLLVRSWAGLVAQVLGQGAHRLVRPRTLRTTPANQLMPSEGLPPPVPLSRPFIPFPCPVCSLTCPHFVSVQPKKTFMEQPLTAGTCAGARTPGLRRTMRCVLPVGRCRCPLPAPNPVRPVSLAFFLLTCTSHLFSFVAWYLARVRARVSGYINQTDTPHNNPNT